MPEVGSDVDGPARVRARRRRTSPQYGHGFAARSLGTARPRPIAPNCDAPRVRNVSYVSCSRTCNANRHGTTSNKMANVVSYCGDKRLPDRGCLPPMHPRSRLTIDAAELLRRTRPTHRRHAQRRSRARHCGRVSVAATARLLSRFAHPASRRNTRGLHRDRGRRRVPRTRAATRVRPDDLRREWGGCDVCGVHYRVRRSRRGSR